uniref:Uncharacterized protein n=1 Tax=Solibacter usitatus (strain Ellin6076) TaxID=234267 RepID=Q01SN6_SOLUE
MINRFSDRITICGLLCSAVLALTTVPASAGVGNAPVPKTTGNFNNPDVMPLQSSPFGATYEEWSARFWQWQFSLPVNANPIFDTADCSAGQSGHVWFLGGSALGFQTSPGVVTATANRACNVPPGTALFFPVVNNECSTIPGDQVPPFTSALTDLKPCARFASSFIDPSPGKLYVILDGVSIKALTQYEVSSPLFTFGPLPDNNVLQSFGLVAPAGTTAQSVSDGIQLMLHPLSAGKHVLHFHAETDLSPLGLPRFIQDITYYLTVGH